jgi:hypothetical protein
VVDCSAVLQLASEGIDVAPEHELLAPTHLRSQTLSALRERVHRGELTEEFAAERLQADACVTVDAELARRAEGIVPTATIDAITAG